MVISNWFSFILYFILCILIPGCCWANTWISNHLIIMKSVRHRQAQLMFPVWYKDIPVYQDESNHYPEYLPGGLLYSNKCNLGVQPFSFFSFWLILTWCLVLPLRLVNEWLGVLGLEKRTSSQGSFASGLSLIQISHCRCPLVALSFFQARTSEAFISGTALTFCSHSACWNGLRSPQVVCSWDTVMWLRGLLWLRLRKKWNRC